MSQVVSSTYSQAGHLSLPLHPTFFYHFAWSCMRGSHHTAGHVGTVL
jgi:hypothetical protein